MAKKAKKQSGTGATVKAVQFAQKVLNKRARRYGPLQVEGQELRAGVACACVAVPRRARAPCSRCLARVSRCRLGRYLTGYEGGRRAGERGVRAACGTVGRAGAAGRGGTARPHSTHRRRHSLTHRRRHSLTASVASMSGTATARSMRPWHHRRPPPRWGWARRHRSQRRMNQRRMTQRRNTCATSRLSRLGGAAPNAAGHAFVACAR